MAGDARRTVELYTRGLLYGGLGLVPLLLILDLEWLRAPWALTGLAAAVVALRSAPVRLSKYSYLTQTGVAALVGAVVAPPSAVALALAGGTLAADALLLRKPGRAALVNAGREVLAFVVAFGAFRLVHGLTGSPGPSVDFLPAAVALVGVYFFASRGLFYFTLLLRNKLESEERLLILRYEILSFLLTVAAAVLVVTTLRMLTLEGWLAVLAVIAVLGLLTKRILEEAIAAEDLNKIHLIGAAAARHGRLEDALVEIERLAHRLLDWGGYRIYRRNGAAPELLYRGALGRNGGHDASPELERLRQEVLDTGRPLLVSEASRDTRLAAALPGAESLMIVPLRLGGDTVGTLELDHHNRNAYRQRDLTAGVTLAGQITTALHIAELRRPLVETVREIGLQVRALARATESLRASAAALTTASQAIRHGAAEQEAFVAAGLDATAELARMSKVVASEGAGAAATSETAAEVAALHRETIEAAIRRLMQLREHVAESSRQVEELGAVGRRLDGFIASIREIADLTNLISLNAAIEAARAGQHGRGFGVVAEGIRQLAAQSSDAAREAGRLVAEIAGGVESLSREIGRGQTLVTGVGELSGGAARALESIVMTTRDAGRHARAIAETAAAQHSAFDRLDGRIGQAAAGSAQARRQTEALAEQASEAARGQAELEAAIRRLEELATRLQTITRHFSGEA